MTTNKIKILIIASFLIVMYSCSQKYDDTGIFNPQDPDFFADTLSLIAINDTLSIPKKSLNDGYIYIGTDITAGDTTAWAESVFKVNLPLAADSLDSAFIIYKINSSDPLVIGKSIEILKTDADWTQTTAEQADFNSSLVHYGTYPITSADSSTYKFKIPLDSLSLVQWASDDSVDTQPESFYIKDPSGNNISPVIRLYSSKWAYTSLRPKIYSFYSYPDTLTASGGGDSIITVSEVDSAYITEDISLAGKKSSCLDLSGDMIKLGGISGESYLCRIDLRSIDTSATVLTGRIDLTAVLDPSFSDPVYGNIFNNDLTKKEISVYIMKDSLWHSDNENLNYDSVNVWSYKINLSDSSNFLVMDTVIQKWIRDPDTNFGFMITSKNWGNPFGYSVFLKPKINVSFIKIN